MLGPTYRAWPLVLGLLMSTAPSSEVLGQRVLEPTQMRVFLGGMVQRPTSLAIDDLRSRHSARHLFLGITYQRPIGPKIRLGLGAGMSWGSYGLSVSGQVADSTGSYVISDQTWSRPVWYPFERGFTGPFAWRTDPFQIWAEVVRILGQHDAGSGWEVSALLGAASPLGIYFTHSTDVPRLSETRGSPAYAATTLGDAWHAMIGVSCERVYQFKSENRMSFGLEWRYSFNSYSLNELVTWPLSPESTVLQSRPHFMWLGIRAGYAFTWGGEHKPQWMRQRQARGLAN